MVREAVSRQTDKVERFLRQIVRAERRTERRVDERIPIAIVVAVVPSIDGRPDSQTAFVTLTKNFRPKAFRWWSTSRSRATKCSSASPARRA